MTDDQASGRPRCQATRKDGSPCAATALPGDALCWSHSPALADRRERARSAGARKGNQSRALRARGARLSTPGDLLKFNARLINDLVSGTVSLDVARVVVYATTLQRGLVETSNLDERIKVLERKIRESN